MERTTTARGNPFLGRTNRWHLATLGALVGATALLMVLPATVGATTPGTTLSAPFHHLKIAKSNPSSLLGCGTGTIVKSTSFNKTSGVGKFSDNGTIPACSTASSSSLTQEGSFTVTAPVHVKHSGTYNLSAIWLTIATGSVNITQGSCTGTASPGTYPNCNVSASAFVYGSAYLLDKNTGTKTSLSNHWPGNSTYVWDYTYCYPAPTGCKSTTSRSTSGSLHTGSSYWEWYWNGTALNSAQNYSLVMTIFGGVKLTATTAMSAKLSGDYAFAQLNSGTLGNDETLIQIAVS